MHTIAVGMNPMVNNFCQVFGSVTERRQTHTEAEQRLA
jgi:hypothetical protein